MQRQRLLSDRQHFQKEQMKLIESRSPTTLTPQTPLPLTPSAVKRQFVVPTVKSTVTGDAEQSAATTGGGVAPSSSGGVAGNGNTATSTATSDSTTVNSTSVATAGQGAAKEGMAASLEGVVDQDNDMLPQLDDVIPSIQEGTLTGEHTQNDLLPSVEDVAGLAEDDSSNQMFPLNFPDQPGEDQVMPSEDQVIPSDRVISDIAMTTGQEPMEFESSDPLPLDTKSHQQFEQSDKLPVTTQSDLVGQLPQQTDGAQQLENTSQQ